MDDKVFVYGDFPVLVSRECKCCGRDLWFEWVWRVCGGGRVSYICRRCAVNEGDALVEFGRRLWERKHDS